MPLHLFLSLLYSSSAQTGEIALHSKNILEVYQTYSKQSRPEQLAYEAQKKIEGHFGRSFLPSIDASYAREAYKEEGFPSASSSGWNLEARWTLFNGWRDWFQEKANESRTARAQAELSLKDQGVLHDIRKAFWRAIYFKNLVQTIERAIRDNEEIKRLAERRIQAGLASTVDRLEFRLNGIRLRQDLQRAKNEIRNAQNELKGLLMIPKTEEVVLREGLEDDHTILKRLENRDSSKNPSLRVLRAQAEVESHLSKIHANWYLPKLDLYSGYERPTLRQDSTGGFGFSQWYAGIELRLSLGEVATSIRIRQARDLESQAQLQRSQNTLVTNESKLEALSENIQSLHTLFHETEASIKESEEYVAKILKEYDRGVKNGIDALNATRQAYEARSEGLNVLKEYKLAIVEFLALSGEIE